MWKKKRAPRDEGLDQIAAWQQWSLGAQLEVLATKDMSPDLRMKEIAEAERLSAAIGDRMRADYLIWQNRVV